MIIIHNTANKRVLINIGHITHIEERTTKLLIFLECGEVVSSSMTWDEIINKIKALGSSNV